MPCENFFKRKATANFRFVWSLALGSEVPKTLQAALA